MENKIDIYEIKVFCDRLGLNYTEVPISIIKNLMEIDKKMENKNKIKIVNGNIFLIFKSTPKYFSLEQEGIKPYTIRDIDTDKRFYILKEFQKDLDKLKDNQDYTDLDYKVFIQINSTTGDFQFTRRLKYTFNTNNNQIIINW